MECKKWIDVTQLNEFIKYFSTEELVELSMCSKLIRSKLIPVICKTLKFDCLKMSNFGYKSYLITEEDSEYDKDIKDRIEDLVQRYRYEIYQIDDEEFDYPLKFFINPYKPLTSKFLASRDKLQSDLKTFPYRPFKLSVDGITKQCYLIRELHTTFNNLKILHIQRTWVTFEDLKYLLDNLKCLEDLRFMCNDIFRCNERTIDHSIKWPQTLKKLTYGRNQEMIVDNKYDPIPIHPNTMHPDIPTAQLLLLPTHFPNLESLSFYHWRGEFDDKLGLLKANTHIKKLSLPIVEEILEVFGIISEFQNLDHLDIFANNCSYSKGIDFINSPIPAPPNLKSLTINSIYHNGIIQFLNKSFRQIVNLKVKIAFIHFNQLLLFINNLSAMQSLKNLKLCFELTPCDFDEVNGYPVDEPFRTNVIKFPKLDNLESVEFKFEQRVKNSSIVKMDLSQLKFKIEGCPKLKCIGFKSENNLKCFGKIGSEKLELDSNWRLISNPRRYLLLRA